MVIVAVPGGSSATKMETGKTPSPLYCVASHHAEAAAAQGDKTPSVDGAVAPVDGRGEVGGVVCREAGVVERRDLYVRQNLPCDGSRW